MDNDKPNPYPAGKACSAYHKPDGHGLKHAFSNEPANMRTAHLHHILKATIESPSFPCYGAKAAVKKQTYRFALYQGMDDPQSLAALQHDLFEFAQEQKKIGGSFTTFIVCFEQMPLKDVYDFEDKVWKLLGELATEDVKHHDWDPHASSDTASPEFSFSFAGTSYFVAALSPVSLRMSRQFVVPALVFNAHYQFQEMRQKGTFDTLKDKVREKDKALENGMTNHLASSFGETTDATVQYVGAPPKDGKTWQCPFSKYFKGGKP